MYSRSSSGQPRREYFAPPLWETVFTISVVVALTVAAGCRLPEPAPSSTATQLDRLMETYPELRGGRFLVIADFEDPRQMELFQLIGVSDAAGALLSRKREQAKTGPGCLLFSTASPDDTIVINNERAKHWYLKRNWRPYDLLLMSIQSPQPNLVLETTIAGGPPEVRRTAHASIRLQKGWNGIRLDLAEIGEHVPLDDVQEIRIAVSGASRPVQLRLDDIILTGFRKDLFGNSSDRDAGLYVQQIGRRWKIGAGRPGADFELTFANGQIVEWYNIGADPYRLRNLVRSATLGPIPVSAGAPDSSVPHPQKWLGAPSPTDRSTSYLPGVENRPTRGSAVAVRSRIVEMNAVRAVVASEWRFAHGSEAARDSSRRQPFHRWVYTIYPTGQLYVAVETARSPDSRSAFGEPPLGLAVTLSAAPEDEFQTHIGAISGGVLQRESEPGAQTTGSQPRAGAWDLEISSQIRVRSFRKRESDQVQPPAYATARSEPSDTFLLYVVNDAEARMRITESDPGDDNASSEAKLLSLVAIKDARYGYVDSWACHMLLGASSEVSDDEALARAIDYAGGELPRLELGSWVSPGRGGRFSGSSTAPLVKPSAARGFDPATGCFRVAPYRGRIRLVIDGAKRPRFSPAFQIMDSENREAWVYVNDRIFDRTARDAQGNLIFQLPGTIRERTLVEVLFRR